MKEDTFCIGVGGHQDLGDEVTQRFVAEQFRAQLRTYQQQEPGLVLYSALAMGADQLFLQIALEMGIPIEAVLPCAEYEKNYVTDESRNEYQRLLRACRTYHQLPIQTCSDDAYLAAGEWIIEHSHLAILAWNGLPPLGSGGTGDMASYARQLHRPFIHIDTRHHTVTMFGKLSYQTDPSSLIAPKRAFITAQKIVYQGPTLRVNQYQLQLPDGEILVRDIAERPDSVLILPVCPGKKDEIVLLIEEYDLGAGKWQLKLPGGKVQETEFEAIREQAQRELRQETGYRAGRWEPLLRFHSHPGYVAHRVHLFVAHDLEWDPLELEAHEEVRVRTYLLQDALAETLIDYRCDPEAALALWLYAHKSASGY